MPVAYRLPRSGAFCASLVGEVAEMQRRLQKDFRCSHGALAAHAVERVNMLKQDWTRTLNPNDCIMIIVRERQGTVKNPIEPMRASDGKYRCRLLMTCPDARRRST